MYAHVVSFFQEGLERVVRGVADKYQAVLR